MSGEELRRGRRSASPATTKVSLLQDRLFSRNLSPRSLSDLGTPKTTPTTTSSNLKSPGVVKKAAAMGNVLNVKRTSQNKDKGAEHKIQVKVELSKGSEGTTTLRRMKETLTLRSSSSSKIPKTKKSVKISPNVSVQNGNGKKSPPQPSKPPRKAKNSSTTSATATANSEVKQRSPTPTPTPAPQPPPQPTSSGSKSKVKPGASGEGTAKKKHQQQQQYTVTHKPLAPPAESTPTTNKQAGASLPIVLTTPRPLFQRYSESCALYSSTCSLPSLTVTPYLRRVTESVFLSRGPVPRSPSPRPTKTSLMRELIAREPLITFKDSSFRSSPSLATLEGGNVSAIKGELELRPRGRRRRSVSCLNLRDYSEYICALRSSARPRSPRFSRLHSLYSSLERLVELEASSSSLGGPVLAPGKQNDFEAWWSFRSRRKMEEEIAAISKELFQAQKEREFFFRPKVPNHWSPHEDGHLRFKRWGVGELKRALEGPPGASGIGDKGSGEKLDLYKAYWRGASVKELALNLEVNECLRKERTGFQRESAGFKGPGLRRAFSMSSTLSQEQREGIKERIGHLLTVAAKKEQMERGRGLRVVTSRMGFTLSSKPKDPESLRPSPDKGLSEGRKKEISQKISAEFKERRVKDILRDAGGIPKKKPQSHAPFYSLYSQNGVEERIAAFEQVKQLQETTPPFRSRSPPLRTPSPSRRNRSVSPRAPPPPPRDYVSHVNVISKLASLLLKRNGALKTLVTREVLERERLERLRHLNTGEVERLRDFFEERERGEWGALSPEISLLRSLFCSDSNLAKVTHKKLAANRRCASAGGNLGEEKRQAPDGSSPTPPSTRGRAPPPVDFNLQSSGVKTSTLTTRSRKPIYQPSSTPNVCQPTLTAHCYLSQGESYETLQSPDLYTDGGSGYDSLPLSYSSLSSHKGHVRGPSYSNYDPAVHQPRYRYVPPPPQYKATLRRSESALGYGSGRSAGVIVGRRVHSFRGAAERGQWVGLGRKGGGRPLYFDYGVV